MSLHGCVMAWAHQQSCCSERIALPWRLITTPIPTSHSHPQFYSPGCGHCQQLAPTFKRVANALKGVAKVRVLAAGMGLAP